MEKTRDNWSTQQIKLLLSIRLDVESDFTSVTYRRIKRRNAESGRDATAWEFFDTFDEVFGTKHSIVPPVQLLSASLSVDSPPSRETPSKETPSRETPSREAPSQSSSPSSPPMKRQKKSSTIEEILQFLQKESEEEKRKDAITIAIEKEKMEIERERIEVLKSLRDCLEKAMKE